MNDNAKFPMDGGQPYAQSFEQFLWTTMLARARARLQAPDFAELFSVDQKCGTIFGLPSPADSARFLTIFVDKIVRKGTRPVPSP